MNYASTDLADFVYSKVTQFRTSMLAADPVRLVDRFPPAFKLRRRQPEWVVFSTFYSYVSIFTPEMTKPQMNSDLIKPPLSKRKFDVTKRLCCVCAIP
ncbi:hypothetical protein EVAR_10800_1 [Eumeta japonica]|uniref:Uncharacterized protein n=1 Tax=Eumeta variegata TaxID=151549 RepID=A0A4C1YAN9_EUMVA|nr:hypothetical protein EVAR_10800_1 [Eumeta japonica]